MLLFQVWRGSVHCEAQRPLSHDFCSESRRRPAQHDRVEESDRPGKWSTRKVIDRQLIDTDDPVGVAGCLPQLMQGDERYTCFVSRGVLLQSGPGCGAHTSIHSRRPSSETT